MCLLGIDIRNLKCYASNSNLFCRFTRLVPSALTSTGVASKRQGLPEIEVSQTGCLATVLESNNRKLFRFHYTRCRPECSSRINLCLKSFLQHSFSYPKLPSSREDMVATENEQRTKTRAAVGLDTMIKTRQTMGQGLKISRAIFCVCHRWPRRVENTHKMIRLDQGAARLHPQVHPNQL